MTEEYYYRGLEVDIRETNGLLTLYYVDDDGHENVIPLEDQRDAEVLITMLTRSIERAIAVPPGPDD